MIQQNVNDKPEFFELDPMSLPDEVRGGSGPGAPMGQPDEWELFNNDVNSLVGAAACVFIGVFQLTQKKSLPERAKLHGSFVKRIQQFEQCAKRAGYHPNIILAARYVLCAWVDECVEGKYAQRDMAVAKNNLLKTFQGESWGGERFFLILKRSLDNARWYTDLLELMYLCLSFGFKGKYRMLSEGDAKLEHLTEELYRAIRRERGECSNQWLLGEVESAAKVPLKPKLRYVLLLSVPLLTCLVIGGVFVVMHDHLGERLAPFYQKLKPVIY